MKSWSYIITGLILIIEVLYIEYLSYGGLGPHFFLNFISIFFGPLYLFSLTSGILLLLIGFKNQNKKTFISLIFSIIAVLVLLLNIIYFFSPGEGLRLYYFVISVPIVSILLFVSIIFSIIGMRETKKQQSTKI